jgi:predicted alpha/beta-hydrolase family hydrolase
VSEIRIETSRGSLSAVWNVPTSARAGLLLAPGAGSRFDHPGMEGLARALADRGFAVLRFNFPYGEAGRRLPDRAPVLVETWREVFAWAREQEEVGGLPLLAGGRSMGGRMASLAAAHPGEERFRPAGLVFFAYPLHPPRRLDRLRSEHLSSIEAPLLFISGTRDPLCDVDTMNAVLEPLRDRAELVWLEGADHGFHVLRRSGRDDEDVQKEAARTAEHWWDRVLTGDRITEGRPR